MRNIDALNQLLSKECPDLPSHRRTVSDSLSNITFLKKVISKKDVSGELQRLVFLNPKQMFEEYKEQATCEMSKS